MINVIKCFLGLGEAGRSRLDTVDLPCINSCWEDDIALLARSDSSEKKVRRSVCTTAKCPVAALLHTITYKNISWRTYSNFAFPSLVTYYISQWGVAQLQ